MIGLKTLALALGLSATLGCSPDVGAAPVRASAAQNAPSNLPPIRGPIVASNWTNAWASADWSEAKLGAYPWSAANARLVGKDLVIRVTEKNSGEVQQNGAAASLSSRWEVDATAAPMTPGLIQAPLWLYNKDTRDEIDFEYVGDRGLHLTIYKRGVAVWSKTIQGDFTREHLALEYRAGRSVVFFANGTELATVTPDMAALPDSPMKAYIEMWVTTAENWAGRWPGAGNGLEMRIHGFRQTAL